MNPKCSILRIGIDGNPKQANAGTHDKRIRPAQFSDFVNYLLAPMSRFR